VWGEEGGKGEERRGIGCGIGREAEADKLREGWEREGWGLRDEKG